MVFIEELLYCSFCGRAEDEVDVLYAGQDGAMICKECVEKISLLFKKGKLSLISLLSHLLIATITLSVTFLSISLTKKSSLVSPSFPSTTKTTISASSIARLACILILIVSLLLVTKQSTGRFSNSSVDTLDL